MTCPSPREIDKVMASMTLGPLSRGCSLDELLEKCIHSFDTAGGLCRGDHMLNMALTMHSWVLSSADLAQRLLSMYQEAKGDRQEQRRLKICNLVRYWMGQYPEALHLEPHLDEILSKFWELVRQEGNAAQRCLGTPLGLRAGVQVRGPELSPASRTGGLAPRLMRVVQPWRALLLHLHFLPQRLRQLQNFNTLMAVTGGLCHSAISRLKDSHAHLSPDSTKTLLELTELLSSHNNYALYRRAWASCSGFQLPILGVHLKDLVSLHQAMPDRLPDGQLHVAKLNSLYLRLQELRALQAQSPPGGVNQDLLHLLTLSLDLFYTEDEIYELSYAREPRCPKTLPPSPFKAPLVVEWAPGVAPKPDRITLSRHVEQLVESVFKNYDPEGRGTISQEDFERLSSSFPFACHGLHPPPRQGDGPFSQEELTAYLLRASAICAKLGLSFLHPFHEVTFKKPTFCGSCSGFLWGVTKQGYRCRDCGLCCHRHCKDRVEVECKKKVGANPTGLPPPQEVSTTGSEESSPYPSPPRTQKRANLRHAWTQTESALNGATSDKDPTPVL
ncbi:RAS guanyl-releasing protein 4 [Sarcophilus harrisii]|uniref:RAS guanyl-releasing protein 4 n=1 Tax=Sarcophilus harrisii TaxID=9305 RepID=UPI001301D517|nr:RAS guanyl-releasing protein 4 [Sarcophilus harrisii]